jgi:uncharacterized protein YecE (DUF72 family)
MPRTCRCVRWRTNRAAYARARRRWHPACQRWDSEQGQRGKQGERGTQGERGEQGERGPAGLSAPGVPRYADPMRPPVVLYSLPRRQRTDYRIGLSAWTDKSMIEEGEFYPRRTMTAEERLWWYCQYFDVVEVNSSFYAIPSSDTAESWVQRTPAGFLFNVKAYGLLTGHELDAARLPDELRKLLPATARDMRSGRIPPSAVTDDARAWAFEAMRTALGPLRRANKLGYVLFQLAPWVRSGDEALRYLDTIPRALPDTVIAVEFRSRSWFDAQTDETLKFLADHGLAYVSIDGPRTRGAVPSLTAVTAPTAVFRLHGRNFQGWLQQVQGKAPTVAEKYDYLYSRNELEDIARVAGALNGKAERVHVAMNNNNRDYPVRNGIQLKEMLLEDWHPPDREALIEELDERRAASRKRSSGRTARRSKAA